MSKTPQASIRCVALEQLKSALPFGPRATEYLIECGLQDMLRWAQLNSQVYDHKTLTPNELIVAVCKRLGELECR